MTNQINTKYSGCYLMIDGCNIYYTQDDWNLAERYMGTIDNLNHIKSVVDRYLRIKFGR
jgi:hypothetical protein